MSSWVYAVAITLIASVTLLVALDKVPVTEGMAMTVLSSVGAFLSGLFLPQPKLAQTKPTASSEHEGVGQ